jgi:hypothetical protein
MAPVTGVQLTLAPPDAEPEYADADTPDGASGTNFFDIAVLRLSSEHPSIQPAQMETAADNSAYLCRINTLTPCIQIVKR